MLIMFRQKLNKITSKENSEKKKERKQWPRWAYMDKTKQGTKVNYS